MNYEPLAELIEPYADGPFDKLPDGLRQLVIEAFDYQSEAFDAHQWDGLTPDQRRSLAQQHDVQNDPAMEPENRYWHDLGCEILATESKITEWGSCDRRLPPSEALIWEAKRAELDVRLDNLKKLETLPPFLVKDWKGLTDDALAKLTDAALAESEPWRDNLPGTAPATTAPAQNTATPVPVESKDVMMPVGDAKPLQRSAAQDAAILGQINELKLNPMALPKNKQGKPGVKSVVRKALNENKLFTGTTVFDKAWERLSARGEIVIQG